MHERPLLSLNESVSLVVGQPTDVTEVRGQVSWLDGRLDDTKITQGYTGDFIGRVMPRRSSVHNPRYCGSRYLRG